MKKIRWKQNDDGCGEDVVRPEWVLIGNKRAEMSIGDSHLLEVSGKIIRRVHVRKKYFVQPMDLTT